MISEAFGTTQNDDFTYSADLLKKQRGYATGTVTHTDPWGIGSITSISQAPHIINANSAGNIPRQVGGVHYTKLAIDPFTYAQENGLDSLQFSVVKYVTRFREKGGIEDLNKAIDCLQRLVKFEHSKGRK